MKRIRAMERADVGLRDSQIPTLQIVDDTFDKHRDDMEAVIQAARKRAGV